MSKQITLNLFIGLICVLTFFIVSPKSVNASSEALTLKEANTISRAYGYEPQNIKTGNEYKPVSKDELNSLLAKDSGKENPNEQNLIPVVFRKSSVKTVSKVLQTSGVESIWGSVRFSHSKGKISRVLKAWSTQTGLTNLGIGGIKWHQTHVSTKISKGRKKGTAKFSGTKTYSVGVKGAEVKYVKSAHFSMQF